MVAAQQRIVVDLEFFGERLRFLQRDAQLLSRDS
jgi:hypothetical protein